MKKVAIMYSGGTDSTAATALLAPEFDDIHLLTFDHSGLKNVTNSGRNIPTLKEHFGAEKFRHVIIDIDDLFRAVVYADYWKSLHVYGLLNLTSCGQCKLSMHLRTLIYCLDNGIATVADGANKNMSHFPAQMIGVLELLRQMYQRFGITLVNPVFEMDQPEDLDWAHKLGLASLAGKTKDNKNRQTTGRLLYEQGILPAENVKGTPVDRQMQARCFQLILLNLFALGYFIPTHGMEKYQEAIRRFYAERIELFVGKVEAYLSRGADSEMARWINKA